MRNQKQKGMLRCAPLLFQGLKSGKLHGVRGMTQVRTWLKRQIET